MLTRDQHDAIVSRLYAAAAGDCTWQDSLGHVADAFGQSAGVLVVIDAAQTSFRAECHGGPVEKADTFYASDMYFNDPRSPYHIGTAPGHIYYDHALYDVEAMNRHPDARRTIEFLGLAYQLGARLRMPHSASATLALLSTEQEGHASEAEIRAFRRLAPHVEQACALGELIERSASTQAALLEALAAKADGVMLLTAVGTPAFVNDTARAILSADDGLGWSPQGFATRRAAETRRLRQMIDAAISSRLNPAGARPGGQMLVTRPSARRPYVVRVLPAPSSDRFLSTHTTACIVQIHDLAAVRTPSRALLHAVFGLTGRETDLAVELVRHVGLAAAAQAAGMAHNTARNHLQAIFRKCAIASQAEAVQLFARLA